MLNNLFLYKNENHFYALFKRRFGRLRLFTIDNDPYIDQRNGFNLKNSSERTVMPVLFGRIYVQTHEQQNNRNNSIIIKKS
jgi:hypothetical protein